MQSCISNNLRSLEDDDVYFSKKDVMSERAWEKHLERLKAKEEIQEETEVEELDGLNFED